MALLTQQIQNGKVVETETLADKIDKANQRKNNGLDKEAFLQLLVAQMQYQDPLEPMDNTEYISQLATFSTLEEMQNMRATTEYGYANNLVGKYVIINTDTGTVHGKVDYVMYEKGNIFLAVNDGLYSLEDLDTVADSSYYEAVEMANLFSAMIAAMPDAKQFNTGNVSDFEKIKTVLESMNAYQQSFIPEDDAKKYKDLLAAYEKITGNTSSNTPSTGNTDSTESTGKDDLKDE